MIHDVQRVEALRDNYRAGLQALSHMEEQVKDPGFREQLRLPRYWFEDMESHFIRHLETGERTPEEEARWLNGADLNLLLANQRLKYYQDLFDKRGPDIMVV